MQNYEIVIEASCDLPRSIRQKFGVCDEVIRGVIYDHDTEKLADPEFNEKDTTDYFKYVKANVGKLATAFATYEEFIRVVEPILKAGKDVIIFTLSGGISGTYNAFRNYKDILSDDYPDRKIFVCDTLKFSAAAGLLAIVAAQNKANGMSVEENFKWCEENKYCLHEIGPMDDLSFLAKSHRIKAGKAFFGSLIGVQPVADFTTDGRSEPLGTIKGDKATNDISLKYLLKTVVDIEKQIIVICHSGRKERAEVFKEQLLKVAQPKEIIILSVGEICGPNIGPGLCAYFYFGSKLTENRENEKKAFEEIQ